MSVIRSLFFSLKHRDIMGEKNYDKIRGGGCINRSGEKAGQSRFPRNKYWTVSKEISIPAIDGGNIRWKDFPRFDG